MGEYLGGGGGIGGGLEDDAVACGDGPQHRGQRQHKGVVPGGHHQHHPIGLGVAAALGGEQGHGSVDCPGLGPAAQVGAEIGQLFQHLADLTEVALVGVLAQIRLEGCLNVRLHGQNVAAQTVQSVQTGDYGQGGARAEVGVLVGNQGGNIHGG